MSNNEIKEKYGIEPIMKEMWVWDDDITEAELFFVVYKRPKIDNTDYPYYGRNESGISSCYTNASETNPNEKEPKIGDKGYFWDDEKSYHYSDLKYISPYDASQIYYSSFKKGFQNFSHEKQSWMK